MAVTKDFDRTNREISLFNPNDLMSMLLEPIRATSSSTLKCFACRMNGAG